MQICDAEAAQPGSSLRIEKQDRVHYDALNECALVWQRSQRRVTVYSIQGQNIAEHDGAALFAEARAFPFKLMPGGALDKSCFQRDPGRLSVQQHGRVALELSSRRLFARRHIQEFFWLKQQTLVVVYDGELVIYRILFPVRDLAPIVDHSFALTFADRCDAYQVVGEAFLIKGTAGTHLFTWRDGELSYDLIPQNDGVIAYFALLHAKEALQLYDRDENSSETATPRDKDLSDTCIFGNFCVASEAKINNTLLLFLRQNAKIMIYQPEKKQYIAMARLPSAQYAEMFVEHDTLCVVALNEQKLLAFDLLDAKGNFPAVAADGSSCLLSNAGESLCVLRAAYCSALQPEIPNDAIFSYPLVIQKDKFWFVHEAPDVFIKRAYQPSNLSALNKLLNICYYRSFTFGQPFMQCFQTFVNECNAEIFPVLYALLNSTFEFQICKSAGIKAIPLATRSDSKPHSQTLHVLVQDHQSQFVCAFAGKRYALPKIFTLYLTDIINCFMNVQNVRYQKYCVVQLLAIIERMQLLPNFEIWTLLGRFSFQEIEQLLRLHFIHPSAALASAISRFDDGQLRALGQKMLSQFFIN